MAANLSPTGNMMPLCEIQPINERKLRPLAALEPEQQCEVWDEAVRSAEAEGEAWRPLPVSMGGQGKGREPVVALRRWWRRGPGATVAPRVALPLLLMVNTKVWARRWGSRSHGGAGEETRGRGSSRLDGSGDGAEAGAGGHKAGVMAWRYGQAVQGRAREG